MPRPHTSTFCPAPAAKIPVESPPIPWYSCFAFVALVSPSDVKRSQGSNLRPFFTPGERNNEFLRGVRDAFATQPGGTAWETLTQFQVTLSRIAADRKE